ncbi:DnaJ subfamily C member 8 [Basidiobolus ranarum]|uniref:DnaJ subfamily C member 8 n=1 Tax=Basidiobolus ranarum TaxID=34480 RepID=A0ABR2WQX7_9FUNG
MSDPITRTMEQQRDDEVVRILGCFKLNPFEILTLDPETCTNEDIKINYRKKSLLIHPDKCHHPDSQTAFDLLKKAEVDAKTEERREFISKLLLEARFEVSKEQGLKPDSEKLKNEYKAIVEQRLKKLLIDIEWRKRKLQKLEMEREGAEATKKEEEVNERKRKIQEQKMWDEGRDARVGSWRTFLNKKSKKKSNSFKPPKGGPEQR